MQPRQLQLGEMDPAPAVAGRRNRRIDRPSIQERFEAFHDANPRVFELFEMFALQLKEAGFERYSSDALLHRLRWHHDVEIRSVEPFKLNDHFTSRYARLLAERRPEFTGFFETRKVRTE
jgi:hypothetical protein